MQELTLVGVDANALIATTVDGSQYRLVVDDALRARVRQVATEPRTGTRVSPREIQAHIRSGLSAVDVAKLTHASLADVERFEGPILAEREHIVALAHATTLSHDEPENTAEPFGEIITRRLEQLRSTSVRWSSWKDDEPEWNIRLEFTADEIDHEARWHFDPKRRLLRAANGEATALATTTEARDRLIPRLRAVSPGQNGGRFDSDAFDVAVIPLRPESSPEVIPHPRPVSSAAATQAAITRVESPAPVSNQTADLLEKLRRRRAEGEEHNAPSSDVAESTSAPISAPVEIPEPIMPWKGQDFLLPAPPVPEVPVVSSNTADVPRWNATGPQNTGPAGRRRGRAAMPSWDEIVFGARSEDDPA